MGFADNVSESGFLDALASLELDLVRRYVGHRNSGSTIFREIL